MNMVTSLQRSSKAQRRTPRLKTFLPLTIEAGGESARAHLLDISITGARIHTDKRLQQYASVRLLHDGDCMAGRVMWCSSRGYGVLFDTPISDAAMQAICGAK